MLALIVGVPIALTLLLRSNAAVIFMALCTGSVVEHYTGTSASLVASSVTARSNTTSFVHMGLLVLPALLVAFILKKSISATKMPFNIVPVAALGLVTALLLVPLLPGGVQANVMNTDAWRQLYNYSDFIIAAGTLASVVVLALTYKTPRAHRKHK